MAHVLIVTLGPIQDFIAASRRTRDLWFGSWLLSELSKATAQAIARECGLESLVFPGVIDPGELGPGTDTSVANKIVVRVPDGRQPADVAERGRRGMQARLADLRNQAFEKILDSAGFFLRETAEAHVDDLIEYNWVSAPEQDANDYARARRRAEELLAARKNTRLWGKVTWGAEVPKSSIDGERESVLHEDLFEKVGQEGGPTAEQVRKRYGVRPTERLCGVGLLKRHGVRKHQRYAHRFLSTGHLAAWPIYDRKIEESRREELDAAWRRYLETLERNGVDLEEQEIVQGGGWKHSLFKKYDGSLLFENRLAELFEEIPEIGRRQEALRQSRDDLSNFLEKVGVKTPLPYFAILVADGDRMGEAIKRQDTFAEHKDLSKALDEFAGQVRTTVENQHGGELVYSGGDDVLAFVPLHKAVACARRLAEEFHENLKRFKVDETGATPTLSAGIGICHFMDPLRSSLKVAQEAEKEAKKKRDSLAVIVDKRSGPRVMVAGRWGTLDQRLIDYVGLHRNDQAPDGAAYELKELARLLDRADESQIETLTTLVRKEAERILLRKQPEHGSQGQIDPKVLERLRTDLDTSSVSEVADTLIVARLLAQADEEARPIASGGEP